MIIKAKSFTLKNDKKYTLRSPEPAEAVEFLGYLRTVAEESPYMSRYADEITMTEGEETEFLQDVTESENKIFLTAFCEGDLVGNVSFLPLGDQRKMAHRCGIGIAVVKAHWGMGLARLLMSEGLEHAKAAGYTQAELEVALLNAKAKALYEHLGFRTTGMMENAFRLDDGTYISHEYMIKLLT